MYCTNKPPFYQHTYRKVPKKRKEDKMKSVIYSKKIDTYKKIKSADDLEDV